MLPEETYKGYRIKVRAITDDNGLTVYEWLIYKPWPAFTNLTSNDFCDTPDEALEDAKRYIDEMREAK